MTKRERIYRSLGFIVLLGLLAIIVITADEWYKSGSYMYYEVDVEVTESGVEYGLIVIDGNRFWEKEAPGTIVLHQKNLNVYRSDGVILELFYRRATIYECNGTLYIRKNIFAMFFG